MFTPKPITKPPSAVSEYHLSPSMLKLSQADSESEVQSDRTTLETAEIGIKHSRSGTVELTTRNGADAMSTSATTSLFLNSYMQH